MEHRQERQDDTNGNYVMFALKQGTIVANGTDLKAKGAHVKPIINLKTCTESYAESGPLTLIGGTGAYGRISGNVTIVFAQLGSKYTSENPKAGATRATPRNRSLSSTRSPRPGQ